MKNVFIGLSGGVDSAVAALLLKKKYNVTGVHINNLDKDTSNKARTIANKLDIPILVWDMHYLFERNVIDYFKRSLKLGVTPNPCIICNEKIKFGYFYNKCLKEGADYIATGHYARIVNNKLLRARDKTKDQSYFLYRLKKKYLSNIVFPLGLYTKKEVKNIALTNNLTTNDYKESQNLCFMQNKNISKYILENFRKIIGDIVDIESNKVIGKHNGLYFYTIGQREGIRVGGLKKPCYVVNKDPISNVLYVAIGKDNPSLWKKQVFLNNETWLEEKPRKRKYYAQIRFNQKPVICRYSHNKVIFNNPVYAPTKGQSLVLYEKDTVVGGGYIA